MYDVIIVGGGPAGSYVAYRLASLGYEVLVFEEHEWIGEPVKCTGIIGAECVDRFPLFEGTVLQDVSSARLFSPSRREIRVWRDWVQAYIVDRAAFDLSLAQKAQQRGARYILGSRVRDIEALDDCVRIGTETLETYKAKTAVIASGFGSNLPQKLGLGSVGDVVGGAQTEVSIESQSEIEVYLDQGVAPGFFAWFVPLSTNRALVGLFSRKKPGEYLVSLLASLFHQGKIASPEGKIVSRGIPLRPLPKTYRERVIVVGDAAGQVKPTTGGGIYYGLLCAEVAAETLNQALSTGDFSESIFSGYEKAWREMIGRELKLGYLTRRLYGTLSNRQIDYLFRTIESRGIHQAMLQSAELSFEWHSDAILMGLKYIGPWRYLFGWRGKT